MALLGGQQIIDDRDDYRQACCVSEVKHCVEPLYEVSIQLVAILGLRTCPHHP